MLAAVKGIVQGNTVVIEDEDIRDYNGTEVIVTLLNYPQRKVEKAPVDWDSSLICLISITEKFLYLVIILWVIFIFFQ